jgi:hypothetical protein
VLGVTVEAVRGRIKRRTLDHERTAEGVFVLLDTDQSADRLRPATNQTGDRLQSDSAALISPKTRPSPPYATSSKPSARPTPKQGVCSWPPWSGSRHS